ncbi:MAG: NAD-dependent epimerase [Dehalococcoidales bacterium]|jgi:UDP-glucose 4-epimerase|nr:NAD-dependent epimerase [Dehalococcoidales bacterium]|tara:strand:+ start:1338 stop:2219 length:882 start_codon:yes stop_codon:yes gene_type:complete
MKAIVFGGSGFLGGHVADALTQASYETVIFDIRESPHLQTGQLMILGNILDKKAVEKAVVGCDVVYNFAGVADIQEAYNKPIEAVENNILGNTIVLEACRLNKVKRFVFASTIYVYSGAGAFYRSSKHACELIIENYNEVFGLPYTILRYSSLYGPRAGEGNWIYQTLKQAITEGKITRYGNGEEIREYIHVEDAARCSVKVLAKEFENQYVIIAGQQPIKVKDLMIMIREMLGNKIELEFLPTDSSLHYEITPYTFNPKIARRVISDSYLDMGQGLLQCLEEVYKKSHLEKE